MAKGLLNYTFFLILISFFSSCTNGLKGLIGEVPSDKSIVSSSSSNGNVVELNNLHREKFHSSIGYYQAREANAVRKLASAARLAKYAKHKSKAQFAMHGPECYVGPFGAPGDQGNSCSNPRKFVIANDGVKKILSLTIYNNQLLHDDYFASQGEQFSIQSVAGNNIYHSTVTLDSVNTYNLKQDLVDEIPGLKFSNITIINGGFYAYGLYAQLLRIEIKCNPGECLPNPNANGYISVNTTWTGQNGNYTLPLFIDISNSLPPAPLPVFSLESYEDRSLA